MCSKYSIGVDFGTRSARAVLLNMTEGNVEAQETKLYSHGVMDEFLPGGTKLEPDWALQDPIDYLEALDFLIPALLRRSHTDASDVVGFSVDFTSCTMLPVDKEGTPLCMKQEYKGIPHAWLKLWKHHSAKKEADIVTKVAKRRGESFLKRYGGKVSSEWMIPKILEVIEEAPEIYDAADRFMEAGDWVTMQLTGNMVRSSCAAGYKSFWSKRDGYPSTEYFKDIDERLEHVVEEKLRGDIRLPGERAGELLIEKAGRMGLLPEIAVGVSHVDAHVSMPAIGITKPNTMLLILGTSTCHMLLSKEEKEVKGICGAVEDGILPGFFGYEAGQSGTGDMLGWFVKNCVPKEYYITAELEGMTIHEYLSMKASELAAGESGLLAIDWWNGNRSCLVDVDLTGLILGMTLQTKPEEIYRALIEATAYSTQKIIKTFEEAGLPVNEIYACGGIAKKNPMFMQIYADVTNHEIHIGASDQAPALGSAMFAGVAAGKERGGYANIIEAAEQMGKLEEYTYQPVPANVCIYQELFREFETLHDYFGCGGNDVMKHLKSIKGRWQ